VRKKIVIGITDCEKYSNYEKWILAAPDVDVIRLGSQFSNLEDVTKCDGIVLTGGDDVHPRFYGKEIHYPNAPSEFEQERDEFEIETFKKAQENNLPVLGICRGLQLVNCILGGTLKQDLGDLNDAHRRISKDDKVHEIRVEPGTLLNAISDVTSGTVNSSHHQAIDKIGHDLRINCRAEDGTVEGIESSEPAHPFLIAVQWHPERMIDQNSPLSNNLKKAFLDKARKFRD
jgi:putative glutamine amidotransferase